MMKRVLVAALIVAASWSAAEAKGGVKTIPIPPAYDYSREKAPGYVKDYCVDSVGNHIYCSSATSGANGTLSRMKALDTRM